MNFHHNSEAIIVDACMPPSDDDTVVYLKGALAAFLKNHSVQGLILTGFDEDHSAAMGVGLILKKYRPDWIMYPTCYKDTDEAKNVFRKELHIIISQGIKDVEEIAYSRSGGRGAASVKRVKDYKIKLIEDAIREQKKLNITYRSSWNNEVTRRVITPRQIQDGYDRSYLVAFCHLRNGERNFRVDCIVDAEVQN